jgi:pyruvate/2-oxoglutarate dehydrogenase complex dihydrolipoamide dehydrogenase (E3) component
VIRHSVQLPWVTTGRFVAPKTVQVRLNGGGTRSLVGDQVFLNLGTHATIPPIPGLANTQPLTNIELLELDRLPEHLVVLGGGYVGLEFAQAYRRFGSRVTVIEHRPQLLGREDPDVAEELRRILGAEQIEILLGADVLGVEGRSSESVRLRVRTGGGEQSVAASDILVATGRTPNTASISLVGCPRHAILVAAATKTPLAINLSNSLWTLPGRSPPVTSCPSSIFSEKAYSVRLALERNSR